MGERPILEFISTREAAEIVGITLSGIHNANNRGTLNYYKSGNIRLIRREDAIRYRDSRNPKGGRPRKKQLELNFKEKKKRGRPRKIKAE